MKSPKRRSGRKPDSGLLASSGCSSDRFGVAAVAAAALGTPEAFPASEPPVKTC